MLQPSSGVEDNGVRPPLLAARSPGVWTTSSAAPYNSARPSLVASMDMVDATRETAHGKINDQQVELILHSETFRNSEVLRHLLSFLADKTFSGEADGLKEYTIAIDALHKPVSYDPKHDCAVRIQVSRLRQKLAEYYREEGKNDLIVVDLPKGRFKLAFAARPVAQPSNPAPERRTAQMPVWLAILVWLTLLVPITWREYSAIRVSHAGTIDQDPFAERSLSSIWTPEIQTVWRPFLANNRPVILAIEDPLFMELQRGGGIYYRDRSVDEWNKLTEAPAAAGLRKLLNNPEAQPSHYYTTVGEVSAAFLVGKLLATRQQNIFLVRSSELSWQQLADNNVLLVGKQTFFDAQLQGLPTHPQFVAVDDGIENTRPQPGEPKLLSDSYSMAPAEEGEVYALVTRLPGVGGGGEFVSFISNRAAGYVGALQWFTDPDSARTLVSKLTDSKGHFPKYYQVVLKIEFKDEVPTNIRYVLSRTLQ